MIPVRRYGFLLPALLLGSCCHINRLDGRMGAIKTVTYEASVLEKPTVRFTSHRPLHSRPGAHPTGIWGQAETDLERALSVLEIDELSALMAQGAARTVGGRLGWDLPGEEDPPGAVLAIVVDNICFCAPDALAEVEVKTVLKITLSVDSSKEVLFRDCLDWTFEGFYESLQQLAQTGPERQGELLSKLAELVLGRLAEHLAREIGAGS